MITFRFYLVSLIAVFLAIAIGVVIGSTFIEPALVDNLRGQLETVQGNLDERVAAIDALDGEIERLEAYLEQSAPFAVDERLRGTTVLVLAEQGLDSDGVDDLVGRLRQAGATTDGIVWLQDSWLLGDAERSAGLQEVFGLEDLPDDDLRTAAWEALLSDVASTTGSETTPTSSPGTTTTDEAGGTATSEGGPTTDQATATTVLPADVLESPALSALDQAGFVRIEELAMSDAELEVVPGDEAEGAPSFAVVIVTGPGSDFADGGAFASAFARQLAANVVPTVVAEFYRGADGDPERGAHVSAIRDDGELATVVSTVDDLDLIQGQVATALAIADLGQDVTGHYGYGTGAERVLPR